MGSALLASVVGAEWPVICCQLAIGVALGCRLSLTLEIVHAAFIVTLVLLLSLFSALCIKGASFVPMLIYLMVAVSCVVAGTLPFAVGYLAGSLWSAMST